MIDPGFMLSDAIQQAVIFTIVPPQMMDTDVPVIVLALYCLLHVHSRC